MSCLQKKKNKFFYIVQAIKINGHWKNVYRKASTQEIEAYAKAKTQKERLDLTTVSCARPDCDRLRTMTRKQKRDLKTNFVVRYNQFSDIYCCTACGEKHLQELKLLTTDEVVPVSDA